MQTPKFTNNEHAFIEVDRWSEVNDSIALEPGDRIALVRETQRNTWEKEVAGNQITNYQGSNVVTVNKDTIILDTNGWKTRTTKRRMNQVSDEKGLGYWVYQKNGEWYVDYKGKTHKFVGTTVILDR